MRALEQAVYASFPWYDLPEMRAATDRWWDALAALLRDAGVDGVPASLDRERLHGVDPLGACLFTQTCGYPLFTTALGHFRVLGAPCYAVADCSGSHHRSYITVRDASRFQTLEDLRGARFAINEPDSNSGMNLPRRLFAPLARAGRFFGDVLVSGSHAASAELIAAGAVDAAAIDCVTFALLQRYRPAAVRGLRVIARTAATPAPPLVTSIHTGDATVAALERTLHALTVDPAFSAVREPLFLAGMEPCDTTAYDVVMDYERDAVRLGYPVLR